MDELIAAITERTGLPADKARGAAEAAVQFLKEKLPSPIAGQIDGFLSGQADNIAGAVGDAADKLKGMFGN